MDKKRLYRSSVHAMLNQAAVDNLKGEPLPLDFNLQDVICTIEVEMSPEKCK